MPARKRITGFRAFILCGCRGPERFCVCIDTEHLFAAGYNLGSDEGIMRTFARFKKLIGFKPRRHSHE
jgi:endonuclease IV